MNDKNSGVLIAVGAVFLAVVLTVTTVANASRNSSSTMSAVNGPYIAGTTITSSIINARFADIEAELTDSLSRSAKGGMTAALKGSDGTVAAPAFSFTNEPGTGLYRIGATDLGLAVNGTKIAEWTSSANKPAVQVQNINGTVAAPAYSFLNDTGGGLYRIGSNDFGFAVNGIKSTEWSATGFGVGAAPAYPLDLGGIAGGTITTARFGAAGSDYITFVQNPANIGFNAYYNGSAWKVSLGTAGAGVLWYDRTNDKYTFQTGSHVATDATTTLTDRVYIGAAGLTIGASGTAISKSIRGTVAHDCGTIAANTCCTSSQVATVTGAAAGDDAAVGASGGTFPAGITLTPVVGTDACEIDVCNPTTAGKVIPNGITYSCRVFKP